MKPPYFLQADNNSLFTIFRWVGRCPMGLLLFSTIIADRVFSLTQDIAISSEKCATSSLFSLLFILALPSFVLYYTKYRAENVV